MKVLYFAQAAAIAGCHEEEWDVSCPMSVPEFWREAERRHPGLAALRASCRLASGLRYLAAESTIVPENETAVIPPVSGG